MNNIRRFQSKQFLRQLNKVLKHRVLNRVEDNCIVNSLCIHFDHDTHSSRQNIASETPHASPLTSKYELFLFFMPAHCRNVFESHTLHFIFHVQIHTCTYLNLTLYYISTKLQPMHSSTINTFCFFF